MVELSTSTIILEYVCPGIGVLICQFMFSAPYHDLQRAIDRGHIGDLNPTPWAFMLGNCFGWVVYSALKQNLLIFWANAPGFVLSVYLNLGAVKLLYQRHHSTEIRKSFVNFLQQEESIKRFSQEWKNENVEEAPASTPKAPDWTTVVWNVTSQTTPAPAPHEKLVLGVVILWTACMSLLVFAQSFDSNTRELIVGSVVNLNLVFFYGAPLSTIYTVLTQGNSSSIHIRTMVTNTLNGVFWAAYGVAVLDPFIYVPNGLGAFLGLIQIVLIALYPRKPTELVEANPEATTPLTLAPESQKSVSHDEEGIEASLHCDMEAAQLASTDGSSSE